MRLGTNVEYCFVDCILQVYGINVRCVGARGGVQSRKGLGVERSRYVWWRMVLGERGWACGAMLGAKCAWLPRAHALGLCELRGRACC